MDNTEARRLYQRLGFAPVDVFMVAPIGAFTERIGPDERPPSFGSLHVQTDDEAGVERAMKQFLPASAHSEWTNVAAGAGSWVTVTDELCDRDRSAQRRAGAELSERMGVPVVAFALEEEAVVRCLLFDRGRMVDEYLSVPTYYGGLNKADELSLAANPTLVARLTGADPARVRAVVRTASSPSELPPARELLEQVAGADRPRCEGGTVITLYDADRCPYCARTRIALAEKGIEYEPVVIDLDDRPSWIYEKNPLGRVPVARRGHIRPPRVRGDQRVPRGALSRAGVVAGGSGERSFATVCSSFASTSCRGRTTQCGGARTAPPSASMPSWPSSTRCSPRGRT